MLNIQTGMQAAEYAKRRRPAVMIEKHRGNLWLCIETEWHRKRRSKYNVRLDRIDTPTKLLGWVSHLTEKVWFDQYTCRELIEAVRRHFGWDIHGI